MDIAYHWQQQQVEQRAIQFEDIPSAENEADSLTKPLATQLFRTFRSLIHMRKSPDE